MQSKNLKKLLLILFLSLHYLTLSSSLKIYTKTRIFVFTNGSALVNKTYYIFNNETSVINSFILPIGNHSVVNTSIKYTRTPIGLVFFINLSPGETTKVNVRYFLPNVVYKIGRSNFILLNYTPYYPSSVEFYLPSMATIIKSGNNLFLSPKPYKIKTNGLRIIILYNNITKETNFIIGYKLPPKINLYLIVILLTFLFIIILIVLYITKEIRIKLILSTLTEEELKIVKYILNHGNKVKQKELYEKLEFSKAKVSRILRELESRNIIYRKTVKKEKIVRVKV